MTRLVVELDLLLVFLARLRRVERRGFVCSYERGDFGESAAYQAGVHVVDALEDRLRSMAVPVEEVGE